MRASPAVLAVLLVANVVAAAERTAPQPRVRLDPDSHVAVAATHEPTVPSPAPAIMMDRFIVKVSGIPLARPIAAPEPPQKFRIRDGGGFWHGNIGYAEVATGFWPAISLTLTDSPFRPRQVPRLDVDFVRIKF